jgi:hypothetical protein
MKTRKRALLVKLESAYGTDPTPAAATDAVLAAALDPSSPLDQEFVERTLVRHFYGGFEQLPTRNYAGVQVDLEMAGFGSAGPASPTAGYDALMRSAALSRTVNAGVDVQYKQVSSGEESVTAYFYQDGMLHKITGARSEFEIIMNLNEIPLFRFGLLGLFNLPTDTAMVTPVVSAYQKPVAVNEVNTSAFSIHGFSAGKLQSLSLKKGNQLERRNLVGQSTRTVEFTGHEWTGSLEFEAPLQAGKDFYTAIKDGTLGALSITHGPATKQVKLDAANAQLIDPRMSENQGFVHLTMGLRLLPSAAGNDDLTITIK